MKNVVQNDVVEQLLRRFNPFGLRSMQGVPYEFMRVSEIYLFLMTKLLKLCPRGYIELPLVISELYPHLSYNECRAVAESMKPLGLEEISLVDYMSKDGKQFIEQLCRGLHNICETTFDNASFLEAYRLFQNRIEIEKSRKNEKENNRTSEEK